MKRLTETAMIRTLNSESAHNLTESQLKSLYDDFAHQVISICTKPEVDIPAYFTLQYVHVELDSLTIMEDVRKVKKKCLPSGLPV